MAKSTYGKRTPLSRILPSAPPADVTNHARTHAIFLSKFGLLAGAEACPNLGNLFGRQSSLSSVSPLRHHVLRVVLLRAKEQVIGIDAGRIIAVVANAQSQRDRATEQFPRTAMGAGALILPMSRAMCSAQPEPAPACGVLVNVPKKARNWISGGATFPRTVVVGLAGFRATLERLAASVAGILNAHVGLLDRLRAWAEGCDRTLRPSHFTIGGPL